MKRIIDISDQLYATCIRLNNEGDARPSAVCIANSLPYEERSQGEWIIDGHHIRCNRCNEYICNTDKEGNKIPDNFCPKCGAAMRKGGKA